MVNIQQVSMYNSEEGCCKDYLMVVEPDGTHWLSAMGFCQKDILKGLWSVWTKMLKKSESLWDDSMSASTAASAATVMAFIDWLDPLPEGDD